MVADKSLLVEHGPVAAEEAVLGRAGHQPVVVLDRQADVEDLSWRIKFVGDLQFVIRRPHIRWQRPHSSRSPGPRRRTRWDRKG